MPRLPTSLLRKAYTIDPFLPSLLGPCRSLSAAQNELRWLREHVDTVAKARHAKGDALAKGALLRALVKQRASGKPLQYILGTEYFGDLEIKCRPGVLIPRQDTAESISHLVRLLRDAKNLPDELRVLDLCTGTGCIPLLFHHEFYAAGGNVDLRLLGVDISDEAFNLAIRNLNRIWKDKDLVNKGTIGFLKANILLDLLSDLEDGPPSLRAALNHHNKPPFWDVVISNPPYISQSSYWRTTTRSVRGFEPKIALVPPPNARQSDMERGDAFYQPLLNIAQDVEAKIVLFEVADLEQATRVARKARKMDIFDGIEIWRDQPDQIENGSSSAQDFPIAGRGNARSVLCWRGSGTTWLGKSMNMPHRALEDEPHGKLSPSFDQYAFWKSPTFTRVPKGHKPNPE